MRSNAALYDLPPGRTGTRSRPRKRGKRVPKLSQPARQVTDWPRHELILSNQSFAYSTPSTCSGMRSGRSRSSWASCAIQPVKSQATFSSLRISTHRQLPLRLGRQTAGRSRTPSATPGSSCVGRRLRCGGARRPNARPFGCPVPSGRGISKLSAPRSAGALVPGEDGTVFSGCSRRLRTTRRCRRIFGASGPSPLPSEIRDLLLQVRARVA